MELIQNLELGFQTALTIENLLYCLLGCTLGTAIGVLPGLGPVATISMLLPVTFGLDPTAALIMLAGIYYGSAYGGSTTAILVNLPGETSSVITVLDGYQMARNGRAGVAIATAAIGSFFAGCAGTLVVAAFAAPMADLAFRFGPVEYFSLMVLGLVAAISLSSGSIPKSMGMVLFGIALGTVGIDLSTGAQRFAFGIPYLWDGIDFIVIAVGLFAFGEVIASLEANEKRETYTERMGQLMPNREDVLRMTPPILRGTIVGSLVGVLPGAGLTIASFLSYGIEKRVSKFRHTLGRGAIEGVAGPEAANNAAAQTAFIPTLTLGIPGSATMALMLGAMIMHDIQPGPHVMTKNPELFWGLIVSMWIGNVILIILNLPMVGIWVRLLKIPYNILYPSILLFCCIGAFSVRYSSFDVFLAAAFGLMGYALRTLKCELAPLVLGFILGPLLEGNLRRSIVLSQGDYSIFIREPISAVFISVAVLLLLISIVPSFARTRREALAEE